ncbi:PREDICTED: probable arginine--tRNA ligase, mitochondrial [Papilio xuthus]|uniref:Probable arginine--tRNA ligase, mitochondrial n=1 Tax=Papilio xuthus TaxID=66420 RepID=A0AAJ6YYQ1_PAPXU|nr:PREDICTED: probable arginine--tRNA ligase, mitochondrial [Papilio xuthus]
MYPIFFYTMTTKFKFFEKILSNNVCEHIQNSKYMKLKYNHNEKCIVININNDNKDKNIISSESCAKYTSPFESHTFKVDRDIFIKETLNNFNESQPSQPNPKKVVLDFSSPNIAKPFHAGHLRSTIIGNFIANINTFFQNKVVKINYLGDWGTQFGILQYGLRSKQVDLSKFETDPIRQLYEIYVEANKMASNDGSVQDEARKYFANIEQGKTSLENWRNIRDITVQELERVYNRLGIQFDTYHWESDYNGNAIKEVIRLLEENKIITETEEGKKVAQFRGKDVTVLKSDNSTLYLSRDIAALLDRYEKYKFDKMLYVVDNAQSDHFAAVFYIVNQINSKCANACEHVKFGRIKGMSTRTGNVVFLNDILDEAKRKMQEKQKASKNTRSSAMTEEICDILGITAVVINDLKQKRQRDYVFDWDKALQSEGDSGIKLQYLHCRLFSLEQNSGVKIPDACAPEYLKEEVVGDVVLELARYEDVLHRALIEREASIIVNYLFRLARHVNRMFNELNVKNESNDVAAQRLLVFHTARKVVKSSLEILGVRPLNQM